MYKYITRISVAVLMILGLASCTKEDGPSDVNETGYLYVSLKQDITVDPVFKSSAEDAVFALVVYDSKDEIVAAYDDHRELAASPLEVSVGTYRVTASSAPSGAAVSQP